VPASAGQLSSRSRPELTIDAPEGAQVSKPFWTPHSAGKRSSSRWRGEGDGADAQSQMLDSGRADTEGLFLNRTAGINHFALA